MKYLLVMFMALLGCLQSETINKFDYPLELLLAEEEWDAAELRADFLLGSDDIEDRLQGALAHAFISYEQDYWLEMRWWYGKVCSILWEMREERLEQENGGNKKGRH